MVCKYLALKGAPNSNFDVSIHCFQWRSNSNYNVQVLCFQNQNGPNININVKLPCFQTAPNSNSNAYMYLDFKGAPNSNCNVQVPFFQRDTLTAFVMCKYILPKRPTIISNTQIKKSFKPTSISKIKGVCKELWG